MDAFPDMLVNIFFIAVILFFIPVLIYSLNVSKHNKIKNIDNKKTRNAFRLKWVSLPLILYSGVILLMRFSIPQMDSLTGNLFEIPIFTSLLVFFPLIPIYIKYGKDAIKDPNFLK